MKVKDKAIYQAIDNILWNDWDPIGVNYCDGIRDEYEGYIPHIFALKTQGADVFKMTKHLYNLVTIDMGMAGDKLVKEHCKMVAEKIIAL